MSQTYKGNAITDIIHTQGKNFILGRGRKKIDIFL